MDQLFITAGLCVDQCYGSKVMLVIFDCDGVLIDSERIVNQAFSECLAQLGLQLTLEETIYHFKGHTTEVCIVMAEQMLGKPIDVDALLKNYKILSNGRMENELQAIPGVVDVVANLSYPKCVASNSGHRHLKMGLEQTGLMPYFAPNVFSAKDVARPKPAPDLFLHAAKTMGFDPKDCVVVEDSPAGVTGAIAAGMQVLGFADLTPASVLQDAGACTFDSMQELPALLETI